MAQVVVRGFTTPAGIGLIVAEPGRRGLKCRLISAAAAGGATQHGSCRSQSEKTTWNECMGLAGTNVQAEDGLEGNMTANDETTEHPVDDVVRETRKEKVK